MKHNDDVRYMAQTECSGYSNLQSMLNQPNHQLTKQEAIQASLDFIYANYAMCMREKYENI